MVLWAMRSAVYACPRSQDDSNSVNRLGDCLDMGTPQAQRKASNGVKGRKIDAPSGARGNGTGLRGDLAPDLVDELRAYWLTHKVPVFPDQALSNQDLERFTLCFGHFGEDPFFGHMPGHEHIAAIQRNADKQTGIFAEFFHSDWSFLAVPPAGTCLFGITILPHGG